MKQKLRTYELFVHRTKIMLFLRISLFSWNSVDFWMRVFVLLWFTVSTSIIKNKSHEFLENLVDLKTSLKQIEMNKKVLLKLNLNSNLHLNIQIPRNIEKKN